MRVFWFGFWAGNLGRYMSEKVPDSLKGTTVSDFS